MQAKKYKPLWNELFFTPRIKSKQKKKNNLRSIFSRVYFRWEGSYTHQPNSAHNPSIVTHKNIYFVVHVEANLRRRDVVFVRSGERFPSGTHTDAQWDTFPRDPSAVERLFQGEKTPRHARRLLGPYAVSNGLAVILEFQKSFLNWGTKITASFATSSVKKLLEGITSAGFGCDKCFFPLKRDFI